MTNYELQNPYSFFVNYMVWAPTQEFIENSNAKKLMNIVNEIYGTNIQDWDSLYNWSNENRADFWWTAIRDLGVVFKEQPTRILEGDDIKNQEWLLGAKFNPVDSCFNNKDKGKTAIISGTGEDLKETTYGQLEEMVNAFANGLNKFGYKPRDTFMICRPMDEVAVAMHLGVIKFGGSVLPANQSLEDNFRDKQIRIINNSFIGNVAAIFEENEVLDMRTGDKKSIEIFMENKQFFESYPLNPHDVTEVFFTSGTTGNPKGIPGTAIGSLKSPITTRYHLDVKPEDIMTWEVGFHGLIRKWLIYSSLMNNATMSLYRGSYLDEDYGRFLQNSKSTLIGLTPKLAKKWRKTGNMNNFNLSDVRAINVTGEGIGIREQLYLSKLTNNAAIYNVTGGAEMGGDQITTTLLKPICVTGINSACLGTGVYILNKNGNVSKEGEGFWYGQNPGASKTLLNENGDELHEKTYFLGKENRILRGPNKELLRRHGDYLIHKMGQYFCLGRVADIIMTPSANFSPALLEDEIESHPYVNNCAVISVDSENKKKLVVYISLESSYKKRDIPKCELQKLISDIIEISEVKVIDSIPLSITGKKSREVLRKNYYGV
ncbi:MAG: AMP-binding protein [Nanoarchaeota archaeon]|nr:AMP-binding protein [Nanoarchaeota archaeon]